jgi:hypothetical protein
MARDAIDQSGSASSTFVASAALRIMIVINVLTHESEEDNTALNFFFFHMSIVRLCFTGTRIGYLQKGYLFVKRTVMSADGASWQRASFADHILLLHQGTFCRRTTTLSF